MNGIKCCNFCGWWERSVSLRTTRHCCSQAWQVRREVLIKTAPCPPLPILIKVLPSFKNSTILLSTYCSIADVTRIALILNWIILENKLLEVKNKGWNYKILAGPPGHVLKKKLNEIIGLEYPVTIMRPVHVESGVPNPHPLGLRPHTSFPFQRHPSLP